jgi:RimJ/RimL family protein N-acetyltransferase
MLVNPELTEEDLDMLWRILADRTLLARLYPLNPGVTAEQAVRDWSADPKDDNRIVMAARAPTGELRGCVRVDNDELSFFVDRHHWRKGYGGLMTGWVVRRVIRQESARLYANVERNNVASIRLLERAGFQFSGIVAGHFTAATLLRYRLAR